MGTAGCAVSAVFRLLCDPLRMMGALGFAGLYRRQETTRRYPRQPIALMATDRGSIGRMVDGVTTKGVYNG